MEISNLSVRVFQNRRTKSLLWGISLTILISTFPVANGQISVGTLTGATSNAIPVSVPFLTIAPDGRSSGMADIGAASMPDVNAQHWNAAKYPFIEKRGGIALTFSSWATNLIPDIYHLYFSGYHQINEKSAISTSFRYFSLATVTFGPAAGTSTGEFYSKEMAIDAGYSRKFTNRFSGGVVLRYIHSDLISGQTTASGEVTQPGRSVAGDLGLYYQDDIQVGARDAQWALGVNVSNVGTPVSYSPEAEGIPIPTNLRLGSRFSYNINENHHLSLHADLNKLLVPTPGLYKLDTATNDLILIRGHEVPGSVIGGMLQSFYDAPGVPRSDGTYSVALEELNEMTFGLGTEYWYKKQLAFRTGYFHEHPSKGNRKYFTFGAGARFRFLTFDLSYLLPVNGMNSPLFNTFRFSVLAELGRV